MNKNIEVINENLWAVNFDLVDMGYIKELNFEVPTDAPSAYTQDGKLVLNKSYSHYQDTVKYMKILMQLRDEELASNKGFYYFLKKVLPKSKNFNDKQMEMLIAKLNLKDTKVVFLNLSEVEKNRRKIKAEYIKGNQQPFGIDTIKRIFKKGGSNYGKH